MKRHEGQIIPPFELEDHGQFHARERLQDEEQIVFVHEPVFKIVIAVCTRKHDQAIWPDLLPEGFVIHRLQPFHDVVNVFEFHSKTSLSERLRAPQICPSMDELIKECA